MTWVGEQSRAKRVLLGWVATEGTRPRISNRVRLDIRGRDIRGRVPSAAAHPAKTRFARDWPPTQVKQPSTASSSARTTTAPVIRVTSAASPLIPAPKRRCSYVAFWRRDYGIRLRLMTVMTGAVLATVLLDAVRRSLTWVGGPITSEASLGPGGRPLRGRGRGYPDKRYPVERGWISAAASLQQPPTRAGLASLVTVLPPKPRYAEQRQVTPSPVLRRSLRS